MGATANSVMDTAKANLRTMRGYLGTLEKQLLDNKVTAAKATSTSFYTLLGTLNTSIQGCSQSPGSDFFSLT